MSLIGGRRLPSQLVVGLEGSGGGRLGSGGSAGRLSDPLRPSTSSVRASTLPAGVLPSVHQGSRLNPGASEPSEGGSRTSPSVSGFLQPSIPRPEGFGVVAPHPRPVDPERLRHLVSLPYGDSTVSPSFHPSGRLDFLDDQFQVSRSLLCREDLLWWARVAQRREGVSLSFPAPDVSFFSDASDVGWGALVGEHHASGLWSPYQTTLSIDLRELLAVQYGLRALEHLLVGLSVALFCDTTTTVAYLRRSGGTFSSTLNDTAREILLWAENHRVRLLPQFSMGSSNVTADVLSRPNQVIGSEWTLHQEVVDHLVHKWPAVIDLFATSLTARLPVYFSPASDSRAAGTDALLQPWDNLQAYAFPPIAIIRRVLVKLRSLRNCELTLIAPFWPQREWFPDLLELLSDVPITLSSRKDLLRQPHFHRCHQNLPMLQLTAWRLSSDSPVRPASLLRWLDNLSSVEDSPHA